jgi:hypothetical protein
MSAKPDRRVPVHGNLVDFIRDAALTPTVMGYWSTVEHISQALGISLDDAGVVVRALGYRINPKETEIEAMARKIAFWHGQKMLYRNRDGMQTVASSRGFGNWGDSAERYADRHWHEYTSAAEQILQEKPPIGEAHEAQTEDSQVATEAKG